MLSNKSKKIFSELGKQAGKPHVEALSLMFRPRVSILKSAPPPLASELISATGAYHEA